MTTATPTLLTPLPLLPVPEAVFELPVFCSQPAYAQPIVAALVKGEGLQALGKLSALTLKPHPSQLEALIFRSTLAVLEAGHAAGLLPVALVLQSAQALQTLRQWLDLPDALESPVLLATVSGDVHAFGKQLSQVLLAAAGIPTLDLGEDVATATILEAVHTQRPALLVLSGLLMHSVEAMYATLDALEAAGETVPVALGAYCLSPALVQQQAQPRYRGAVRYAKTLFTALALALGESVDVGSETQTPTPPSPLSSSDSAVLPGPRSGVEQELPVPQPPFWGMRRHAFSLENILPFLNERMLQIGHWGFRRGSLSVVDHEAWLDATLAPVFHQLKTDSLKAGEALLAPQLTYGFYSCHAEGDSLLLFEHHDAQDPIARFDLPRGGKDHRCLVDYIRPLESQERDVIAVQLATVGSQASAIEAALLAAGAFKEFYFFHGFACELAEATAEAGHALLRQQWGIAAEGEAQKPPAELLKPSAYRGCRYSFGYPACPDITHQAQLFPLLAGDALGIRLTDGFMLSPEQSTSALVFHHPQAHYFSV